MAKKVIGGVVGLGVVLGVCLFVYLLTNNKLALGYNKGYAPEQPIPFDHSLHAGQYKINCQYCHSNVSVSSHSSIPSLNVCMNCHMVVKADSPHIAKIRDAYNEGGTVEWVKIHMLPDHVHFNHKRHVAAGKNCNECHGPVETMQKVYQHSDLSMGWCVNCHRQPENNAPVTCSTCHY